MAAVLQRERRVTAGKRNTNVLIGEELENDEAFWTHDTWKDDDDEANQSYHSSDISSNADTDEFDSDFDLPENDDTDMMNEELAGAAIEREIELEERNNRKKKNAYTDTIASSTTTAATKTTTKLVGKASKKTKGVFGRRKSAPNETAGSIKRVVGDGLNAGIVLNVPIQYRIMPTIATLPQQQQSYKPLTTKTSSAAATVTTSSPSHHHLQKDVHTQPSVATEIVQSNTQLPATTTIKTASTPQIQSTTLTAQPEQLQSSHLTSTLSIDVAPVVTTQVEINPRALIVQPSSAIKKRVHARGPTLASTRVRRINSSHEDDQHQRTTTTTKRGRGSLRKSTESVSTTTDQSKQQSTTGGVLKRGKQLYKQEELLLEAVQETEPNNERWILEQKRKQAIKDDIEIQLRNHNQSLIDKNTIVIEKFVSRRGYYNTITFPNMDYIPGILQQQQLLPQTNGSSGSSQSNKQQRKCIITGEIAKYRDPKTGYGYSSVDAFRELRRRYEANELQPLVRSVHDGKPAKVDDLDEALVLSSANKASTKSVAEVIDSFTKPVNGGAKTKRKNKSLTANNEDVSPVKRGRKSNGKMMKKSLNEPPAMNPCNNEIATVAAALSPPIESQIQRQRTTSTGDDGNILSIPVLQSNATLPISPGQRSRVIEVEIIPRNGTSNQYFMKEAVGNHNNNDTSDIRTHNSVGLSPGGRKSPRTPKPSAKVLETLQSLTASFVVKSPSQQQMMQLPELDVDTSGCTGTLRKTNNTKELPKLPLPTDPMEE